MKPVTGGLLYLQVWRGRVKESLAQFELLNSEALVVPVGELIGGRREAGTVLDSVEWISAGRGWRGEEGDRGERGACQITFFLHPLQNLNMPSNSDTNILHATSK